MTGLGWSIAVLLSGFGLVAVLMRWGVRTIINEEGVAERYFLNQRRRRRMILFLGVVSLAGMVTGLWVSPREYPELFVAVWLLVVFLLCWIMVLGLFDFLSVRSYFRSEESRARTEEAVLRYHLRSELQSEREKQPVAAQQGTAEEGGVPPQSLDDTSKGL